LSAVTTMPTRDKLATDCSCTCRHLSGDVQNGHSGLEFGCKRWGGVEHEAKVGQEILVVDGPGCELRQGEVHGAVGSVREADGT
jgi:hypothetical protein